MTVGLTPECQIIDAEGMGPSPCLFQEMMLRVPHEYSANLANYRILSGVRLRAWYAKYRTERGTEMADNVLSTGNPLLLTTCCTFLVAHLKLSKSVISSAMLQITLLIGRQIK